MDSLRGQLLVAAPSLQDPNFFRTVVLIVEHNEEGAMGIVLNREADTGLDEAVPDLVNIPGIEDTRGKVGPPLDFWSRRTYIAGEVPNTPDYLIRWIQDAPGVDPMTAMPNVHVKEADARDIASYLYTLK